MKVVIYRRLSFKTGNTQYGFDSQQDDLDRWLSGNPTAEIIGDFGEFYSGRGDYKKRPEFNKALELCKKENATLLLTKPDRLARNVESGAHLIDNYNIIFTYYPNADTITKHILLTIAQAESDNTSIRVIAAMKVAARKGVLFGRANPKYNQKSKAVKTHQTRVSQQCLKASQSQADSLNTILKLTQGKTTLSAVCRAMERLEVVTVKGNSKWSPQQIKNLIKQHNIDYSMVKGVVI